MNIQTLNDFFSHSLADIYNAEKQLTKALSKMARAASNPLLVDIFDTHLTETKGQIERLESMIESCGLTIKRVKCHAMEGLIEEGKDMIDAIKKGPLLDAALISAAQKVEHYEISSYGTLIALSKQLGYTQALPLLEHTLAEEKSADKKLTEIAETGGNQRAASAHAA